MQVKNILITIHIRLYKNPNEVELTSDRCFHNLRHQLLHRITTHSLHAIRSVSRIRRLSVISGFRKWLAANVSQCKRKSSDISLLLTSYLLILYRLQCAATIRFIVYGFFGDTKCIHDACMSITCHNRNGVQRHSLSKWEINGKKRCKFQLHSNSFNHLTKKNEFSFHHSPSPIR